MKSIFALTRNAILAATLIASSGIVQRSQATDSKASGNESRAAAADRRSRTREERTLPFEFHSSFGINLHHFLYEQALLRKQAPGPGQPANSGADTKVQLPPGQQQLWDAALDYYTKAMIKRDFVSDKDMVTINDQLAESEGAPDLNQSGLSRDLKAVLESVAPVYRSRWWPEHDRANRFWIAVATPLARQFSQPLIRQLTAAFKGKWPIDPVRVDVVEYANWAGAYTTFGSRDRVHITMSTDPGNQGFGALELLFHEASHWMVGPFNGPVAAAIARECKARNKPIPGGLWHAIIFYTVGEFTRRDLSEYRVTDYTPYGYRGLYARTWPNFQRPLELYWQPYLEGKVDFDKAISNLIAAL